MNDEPKVNHVFGDAREGLKLTKEQTDCDVLVVHPSHFYDPENDSSETIADNYKKLEEKEKIVDLSDPNWIKEAKTVTFTDKQIRQGKILNKWKKAGTYEKALILLGRRKEAKLVQIKKAKAEIAKINRAIVALKKCSGIEEKE